MSSNYSLPSFVALALEKYGAPPYTSRTLPPAEDRLPGVVEHLVGDFAQHGHVHEVRVPGVPETLFIVPTAADGEHLAIHDRISRGRIWTARELADVLTAELSPVDFAAVALAKLAFDGEIVAPERGR